MLKKKEERHTDLHTHPLQESTPHAPHQDTWTKSTFVIYIGFIYTLYLHWVLCFFFLKISNVQINSRTSSATHNLIIIFLGKGGRGIFNLVSVF